jgi:ParB-like chromosome segregation protein Spo0J
MSKDIESIGTYEVHAVASLFPMLAGRAYSELRQSLEQNGQQQPIILYNGVLLDGRNRLKILLELGKQPVFQEYNGSLAPDEYILTANLFRRHLTDDQRTMVTTEALKWKEREEAARRKLTGKSEDGAAGGRGKKNVGAKSTQGFREPKVTEKIAALAKTTDYQARQAITVSDYAPELVPEVKTGTMSLRRAEKSARQRTPRPKRLPKQPTPKPTIRQVAPPSEGVSDRVIGDLVKPIYHTYMECDSEHHREDFKRRFLRKLTECWGAAEPAPATPEAVAGVLQ